jgi:hypothetical protein
MRAGLRLSAKSLAMDIEILMQGVQVKIKVPNVK